MHNSVVKFGAVWFFRCASERTDIHADIQTNRDSHHDTSLDTRLGDEVIICTYIHKPYHVKLTAAF